MIGSGISSMKVCYVIESMFNSGGMERVLSVCANALCRHIEVSILTLCQCGRKYYFPLENTVKRQDLGLKDVKDKQLLKDQLKKFFTRQLFDIVVSLGGIDMYFLHTIKDGSKKIVWFHFAIDIAETTWIGPNPTFARKVRAKLQTWERIRYACKYDKIVLISKADLDSWCKYTKKGILIYNPITIVNQCISSRNSKSVISVGRLDFQKGYDYLIKAWSIVAQKHPDWHLDIYGEGDFRGLLQEQIDTLKLTETITLCGRTPNIEEKYPQYSFYVMSSRAEGLGLVLLEAASCGLPLISYDCPSGPSEIIQDGKNGFLVERVGDISGLASAISQLIEHHDLRNQMGENALQIAEETFSLKTIVQQWIDLFNQFNDAKN